VQDISGFTFDTFVLLFPDEGDSLWDLTSFSRGSHGRNRLPSFDGLIRMKEKQIAISKDIFFIILITFEFRIAWLKKYHHQKYVISLTYKSCRVTAVF